MHTDIYIYIHPHMHIRQMWMFVIKQSKIKGRAMQM